MDAQRNASLSAVDSAHSPIDPILAEAGDTARLSLHQLQSAVADISRALNEALRDDRTNAVLYLRRAENFLRPAAQPEISRTVNSRSKADRLAATPSAGTHRNQPRDAS